MMAGYAADTGTREVMGFQIETPSRITVDKLIAVVPFANGLLSFRKRCRVCWPRCYNYLDNSSDGYNRSRWQ